tara:strand:+ start:981 stop:2408 length:1428 start_codon:yes stop_codon:yes gene_type:complete
MTHMKTHNPKILVVGDLIIDEYLWGSSDRISPEAPVQIVTIKEDDIVLGGAGNVIKNLKALGAKVDVISVIGDCLSSKKLTELLKKIKVSTQYLTVQKDRITSKKSRVISANQQVIRFDRESTDEIDDASKKSVLENFRSIISDYDAVLLSDYGKGLFTYDLTQLIIACSNSFGKKVLVDPKGKSYKKYKGSFLLTPNKKEAIEATNINIIDESSLTEAILELKSLCNLEVSLITLSEDGIAVYDNDLRLHPTKTKEIFDVTGAGDTVLASLGFAIASGLNIDESVKFSNLAAGVVIGKIGSATASINEIIEYESSINKSSSDKHIKTKSQLKLLVRDLKERGKKIVFTNGCFDLLHVGHISYLEKAKSYGDTLIVGLNSDKSVKAIKGKDRPINIESDRAHILASIEVVDYVVIFNENTPYDLIKVIKPHTLVKGGDYIGKPVVGEDISGELKLIEFVDGKSSSRTIEKIKKYN